MGLFDGITKAKRSFQSIYDKPGHYIQRIDAIKEGKTRKQREFLVLEKTIIKTFEGEYKAGTAPSQMIMKDWDSFLGDTIDIVCCLTLCEEDEVDDEACEALVSDEQPLAGWIAEVKVWERDRSDRGKDPFTIVKYVRPIPVRELRKILTEEEMDKFFADDPKLKALGRLQDSYGI